MIWLYFCCKINSNTLQNPFFQTCERNRSIKVAIIDHISGPSATVFPVRKIAAALKNLDVVLIVDAAHAPGQINVNLVRGFQNSEIFILKNYHMVVQTVGV